MTLRSEDISVCAQWRGVRQSHRTGLRRRPSMGSDQDNQQERWAAEGERSGGFYHLRTQQTYDNVKKRPVNSLKSWTMSSCLLHRPQETSNTVLIYKLRSDQIQIPNQKSQNWKRLIWIDSPLHVYSEMASGFSDRLLLCLCLKHIGHRHLGQG